MNTQIKKSAWVEHPDYGISIIPLNHSIQIKFNNVKIADSDKVLLLQEQGFSVIYYFPREDIRVDLLYRTPKKSFWRCDALGARCRRQTHGSRRMEL